MANVNSPNGFQPYMNPNVGAVALRRVTLGGTVTAGDVLKRSSGLGVIYDGGALVIGVAAESGVSGDVIPYWPAGAGIEFQAQTSADATYAVTNNGGAYDVAGTTGVQYVNLNDTTGECFRVLRRYPDSEVGNYARVIGVFIQGEDQTNTVNS